MPHMDLHDLVLGFSLALGQLFLAVAVSLDFPVSRIVSQISLFIKNYLIHADLPLPHKMSEDGGQTAIGLLQ